MKIKILTLVILAHFSLLSYSQFQFGSKSDQSYTLNENVVFTGNNDTLYLKNFSITTGNAILFTDSVIFLEKTHLKCNSVSFSHPNVTIFITNNVDVSSASINLPVFSTALSIVPNPDPNIRNLFTLRIDSISNANYNLKVHQNLSFTVVRK